MNRNGIATDGIEDYTHLASDYDQKRYVQETQLYLDSLRFRAMKVLLDPRPDMEIIDVGTGTGSGLIFFAESVKRMVGLDGTEAMLDKAREKLAARRIGNVELVHANALEIPFEKESFDHVISLNFIHLFAAYSVAHQMKFIAEMARVCKTGGSVIVEFDNALYLKELGNHYRDLRSMHAGLRVERVVGTYFPKTHLLFRAAKPLADLASSAAKLPGARRFAYKWIVKYVKR